MAQNIYAEINYFKHYDHEYLWGVGVKYEKWKKRIKLRQL